MNPCHTIPPTKLFATLENFQPPCNKRFRSNVTETKAVFYQSSSNSIPTREPTSNKASIAFWDYQFLFTSQRLEVASPIKLKLVDGGLPNDFPSGTYYLIGPGLFIDDYGSTVHPLDGHGYLRAFEIDGNEGEVKFSAKYVKTEAQREECDPVSGSWRFTHRGPFSVLKGGKKLANTKVMKNVANTSILKWGGRLFCLWEGGTPYEIDPETLDTIGSFNLINCTEDKAEQSINQSHVWDVVSRLVKPILHGVFHMPQKRILSHYKVDSQRMRLLIMTCNAEDMVLPQSHFIFYEFDMDFNLLQTREYKIQDHLMVHDWAFTDTHYILIGNRVKLNVSGSIAALCGLAPMISALSVNHNSPTSPIYILPRFSDNVSDNRWRTPIELPQLWVSHVANAMEDLDDNGNLKITVHATACSYRWFNFQNMFGYNWRSHMLDPSIMNCVEEKEQVLPHLVQVSINFDQDNNQNDCSKVHLINLTQCSDFPIINPQHSGYKYRYVYLAASSGSNEILPHFPFDVVLKLDILLGVVYQWSPGSRRFVGEPMFVSKARAVQEDDGYLLVVEYVVSQRRCNLLVLDSKKIGEASALIARFEVPKSLTFPLGFHGTWIPKE